MFCGQQKCYREAPFSIGLSGIKTEDAKKVEEIITRTLEKVAVEGFPQQRIDALLHQHELDHKHVSILSSFKTKQNIQPHNTLLT
jgi:Zn-dependent M16 (insulinase) family peptidase